MFPKCNLQNLNVGYENILVYCVIGFINSPEERTHRAEGKTCVSPSIRQYKTGILRSAHSGDAPWWVWEHCRSADGRPDLEAVRCHYKFCRPCVDIAVPESPRYQPLIVSCFVRVHQLDLELLFLSFFFLLPSVVDKIEGLYCTFYSKLYEALLLCDAEHPGLHW